MVTVLTDDAVLDALRAVPDPEIPACSIVDLGIVERVEIKADAIEVDLLPTFAGCPALDVIKGDVTAVVRALAPDREARVQMVMAPPWTTDRITPAGRAALAEYGIAPPGGPVLLQIGAAPRARCPYCGSDQTQEQSAFGPSPCRTIRYCAGCRNPYEGFKTKSAS